MRLRTSPEHMYTHLYSLHLRACTMPQILRWISILASELAERLADDEWEFRRRSRSLGACSCPCAPLQRRHGVHVLIASAVCRPLQCYTSGEAPAACLSALCGQLCLAPPRCVYGRMCLLD